MALVARDGFDALTMRATAAELGVGAMTLYTYFRSRDELIAALLDEVLGHVSLDIDADAEWTERLGTLVRSHHATLLRFPSAITYFLVTPMTGPHATRFGEVMMAVLSSAGLTNEDVVGGFFALLAMNYGFASFESRRMTAAPGEALRTQAALLTLPREQFPLTVALAAPLAAFARTDRDYEFALNAMVAGLASRLESP